MVASQYPGRGSITGLFIRFYGPYNDRDEATPIHLFIQTLPNEPSTGTSPEAGTGKS
ncbi:MAG: hypothetical protein LBQ60_09375 [Bacteroidales bacterium]|nr:hypothetical protein [Bacteroidales bacterium]